MPRFSYLAVEASTGRELSGTIEGPTADGATAMLKARGLAPISLQTTAPAAAQASTPERGRRSGPAAHRGGSGGGGETSSAKTRTGRRPIAFRAAMRPKELALFTRQLATLAGAGMPLVRALGVLARQQSNRVGRALVNELVDTIRAGGNLSDGLHLHPGTFGPLYINMVRAGEAGGTLEGTLERLARFLENAERIKGKVAAAMTYPLVVVLLAIGIVAGLMVFVVPKFEQIFADLLKGQPLPALTRAVIGVSAFVQQHAVLSAALIIALGAGFAAFKRTRFGSRAWDRLLIGLPLAGPLFLQAAVARFTRTLGTLLTSGVPILEALSITRHASGNVCVAEALALAHDRVQGGDSLARPLTEAGVFPGMVTSMIEVGEETGKLAEMLGRIADAYDDEVESRVASLTSLIEPLMIVFLAVVVGIVVLALFLPIVSVIQHLL